jgi:hypothetical protein
MARRRIWALVTNQVGLTAGVRDDPDTSSHYALAEDAHTAKSSPV